MPPINNAAIRARQNHLRATYRGLLVCLIISLLAGTLAAQSQPETQPVNAVQLMDEAMRLQREGSKASQEQALQKFEQVRALFHAANDGVDEGIALLGIGRIYADLGERQKALDNYSLALSLFRASGERAGEAVILGNMGALYLSIGENQKALDVLTQSLSLSREAGDRHAEAGTLTNLGTLYSHLGDKQKALDSYALALPIFRALGDRRAEASTLGNIGSTYSSLGKAQQALDNFAPALALYRAVGDHRGEAETLHNIGTAYGALGEKQKTLDNYEQSLALFRLVGDRRGESSALSNLALLERGQGHLAEALAHIEAAIAIVESLRANITNQELRSSYFATVQNYYELHIDLLMLLHQQHPDQGYEGAALQVNERAHARALLEILAEAGADIRQGVDPALVEREASLQQQLNAKAQSQMKLLTGAYTKAQADAIAKEVEALTSDLQSVETQIRQTSPRYAALTQPQPLTLKEIQTQALDADTLLLEYSLGKSRSFLWAVTQSSIKSYELPKREEIETAARRVYELLNARNQPVEGETEAQLNARIKRADTEYPAAAARLSQMVLAPVAAQMGNKRLVVVADGALQYIPFAALPEPAAAAAVATKPLPLAVKHEIVSLPSTSTIGVLRRELKDRKPAPKTVAVLADPVFESDDVRIKRAAGVAQSSQGKRRELPSGMERAATESGVRGGAELRLPRLEGTRDEAEQILALVPPAERKAAFDFAANRQTATSDELSQYRYVHFATHGFLDSVHPELSGIVLSLVDEKGAAQDGFLRAHEIFNLKLPAELVVLSACQTGLGKEVKGEGLVGLTRGFMYAGAPRVVVSLWSVADDATAELMARFYRGMLRDKLRPAAALRAAQVSLMKEREWSSPFYWAAFTLQGEWR